MSQRPFYAPLVEGSPLLSRAIYNIPVFLCLFFCGCTLFSAVPVTLKEVKDYVVGQQESFSYPLNQVLEAAVFDLREMGFSIFRIEKFNQNGLIRAQWQDTSVSASLETITPRLTKVTCKLHRDHAAREYSSEEELFTTIRERLKQGQTFNWEELVAGMAKIHTASNENSPVVGYVATGAEVEIIEEEGEWCKVALMDNFRGYMRLKHLGSAKEGAFKPPEEGDTSL